MLQKKMVRMMSYNDNKFEYHGPLAHTSPIFKKMVILKVKDVFQSQIIRFIHDCLKKFSPAHFHDWFILNTSNHSHATRANATIGRVVYWSIQIIFLFPMLGLLIMDLSQLE